MITMITMILLLSLMLAVASADNFCEPPQDPWDLCNHPERENFLVADPSNCHIFWSCVPTGMNGGHEPHQLDCQEGLGFNENLGQFGECDYEENVPRCSCKPRPVCEDGWTQAGASCFFLSRTKVPTQAGALESCWGMNARLAQISSQVENDAVVGMAVDAMAGNNDGLDYWIDGREANQGWEWEGGVPMEYNNWWGGSPDGEAMGNLKGGCIQLLRKGQTNPQTLDTFYWARSKTNADCSSKDKDNGYICQKPSV